MKSTIAFSKLIILALLLLGGCQDFEQLNNNPNQPESVNPGLLLPSVIFPAVNSYVNSSRTLAHELMQYHVSINSTVNEVQRYILLSGHSDQIWNSYYGRMQDIRDMIELSEELDDPNYKAIAMILRAWMFSILTDTFGDIPYFEATQAVNSNFTPVFDSQEAIYMDMLDQLKQANDLIDTEQTLTFGGDVLYNGNMMNWKKFANSLRLRLLMRISNRTEAFAEGEISELYNDPNRYPLFEDNDEQAVYNYSGELPNVFPPSQGDIFFFTIYVASEFIVDVFEEFNDPRLAVYFQPTEDSVNEGSPEFIGVPSGLTHSDAFGFNGGPTSQSFMNVDRFFRDEAHPAVLFSHAEVRFLLAEAAARGMISADAGSYYRQGIEASIASWGLDMPAGYMDHPDVAWNGDLNKIYLQKYLSQYWYGLEPWFEYRRTGQPAITPGPANINDDRMPVRLVYPTVEQSLNGANYTEAVERIGGDTINQKGWWESSQ